MTTSNITPPNILYVITLYYIVRVRGSVYDVLNNNANDIKEEIRDTRTSDYPNNAIIYRCACPNNIYINIYKYI